MTARPLISFAGKMGGRLGGFMGGPGGAAAGRRIGARMITNPIRSAAMLGAAAKQGGMRGAFGTVRGSMLNGGFKGALIGAGANVGMQMIANANQGSSIMSGTLGAGFRGGLLGGTLGAAYGGGSSFFRDPRGATRGRAPIPTPSMASPMSATKAAASVASPGGGLGSRIRNRVSAAMPKGGLLRVRPSRASVNPIPINPAYAAAKAEVDAIGQGVGARWDAAMASARQELGI
jgi:hypothetical protein